MTHAPRGTRERARRAHAPSDQVDAWGLDNKKHNDERGGRIRSTNATDTHVQTYSLETSDRDHDERSQTWARPMRGNCVFRHILETQ